MRKRLAFVFRIESRIAVVHKPGQQGIPIVLLLQETENHLLPNTGAALPHNYSSITGSTAAL
jgi:hypothetical protein